MRLLDLGRTRIAVGSLPMVGNHLNQLIDRLDSEQEA